MPIKVIVFEEIHYTTTASNPTTYPLGEGTIYFGLCVLVLSISFPCNSELAAIRATTPFAVAISPKEDLGVKVSAMEKLLAFVLRRRRRFLRNKCNYVDSSRNRRYEWLHLTVAVAKEIKEME